MSVTCFFFYARQPAISAVGMYLPTRTERTLFSVGLEVRCMMFWNLGRDCTSVRVLQVLYYSILYSTGFSYRSFYCLHRTFQSYLALPTSFFNVGIRCLAYITYFVWLLAWNLKRGILSTGFSFLLPVFLLPTTGLFPICTLIL